MRRSIIVMLCLCLLLACAVPAMAAEDAVITVTTSASTVSRGDTIHVVVKIESGKAYRSLGFALDFDAAAFEFVAQSGEVKDISEAVIKNFDESKLKFGFAFSSEKLYSGELFSFDLKVKADASFPSTTVSVKDVTVTTASFAVKGAEVTCKHAYDTYEKVDDENHTGKCTICGTPATGKHTWNSGEVTKGSGCDTPGEKTYTCTAKECGATKVEAVKVTGHAWDNDCDTECNNGCGTKRDTTHKYAEKLSSDEKSHWYACTVCGHKKDQYDHTPDRNAPTEKEAQVCVHCGYVIADKLAHVHDVSPQIQSDAEGHWYYCSKLGCYARIDLAPHVYDNDCDIDCNICAYIRIPPHKYKPEWRGSKEGHWRVCGLCNAESEIVPHNPGAPATQDDPQLCEDCHFWIQWPLSHVHNYGETIEHDAEGHWKVCKDCEANSEVQAHHWDEGTVILDATQDHEGKRKHVCTECQEEMTEIIPVMDPEDPTQPSVPQEPIVPAEDEGFPWWILGASAGVLLVIGIVLLVIELIRSRKTNMHGKFSK